MRKEEIKAVLRQLRLLSLVRLFVRRFVFGFFDGAADLLSCLLFWRRSAFHPASVRNILVVRLDRIGDMVLTTPALRALKETHPSARVVVLLRRYTKDIILGLSFVDEVICLEDLSRERLVSSLRSKHFDVSLNLVPDILGSYLSWRAGVPFRIGYKHCGSGIFLTQSVYDDRDVRIRHEVESALEIVSRIGARTKDMFLSVAVHPEGEKFADDYYKSNSLEGAKVIVVHPGSRQSHIRWDAVRFAQVADRLIAEQKARLLLIGSQAEAELVRAVSQCMKEKPFLAVGLPLSSLISLIKRSVLFIGNSTGPMHIAAALKVPVVAIFGNIHPRDSFQTWGPWGVPHEIVTKPVKCLRCHPGDCRTMECMAQITVEDVYNAAAKLLTR